LDELELLEKISEKENYRVEFKERLQDKNRLAKCYLPPSIATYK